MLSNHDSIAAKSSPRISLRGSRRAMPTLVCATRRIHPCTVQNLCTSRARGVEIDHFHGRDAGSQRPQEVVYWSPCRMWAIH